MSNRFQTIYASKETGRWGIFDQDVDLGIVGANYIQDVPASSWTFVHNLNKLPFLVQFYQINNDDSRTEIKPASVSIDINSVTANFGTNIIGVIVLVFTNPSEFVAPTPTPSTTSTSSLPTPTPTPTPTITNTATHYVISPTPTSTGSATPMPEVTPSVTPTNRMASPRDTNAVAKLDDGTVLFAVGANINASNTIILSSAEIYDPTTNTFNFIGNANVARAIPGICKLNNGKILIAGGFDANNNVLSSAEIYDPTTRTFTLLNNNLAIPVAYNCMTLLNDNTVFIGPGAATGYSAETTCQIFNINQTFSTIADTSLNVEGLIIFFNIPILQDGTLFIIGSTTTNAYVYHPNSQTFSRTSNNLSVVRQSGNASLLNDGTVLVTGGIGVNSPEQNIGDIYNPTTGTFSSTTGQMISYRQNHASVVLNDGTVLLAGGYDSINNVALTSAEIYNPTTGTFTATGNMNVGRNDPYSAQLLNDGTVLFGGGSDVNGYSLSSAEIYNPSTGTFTLVGNM